MRKIINLNSEWVFCKGAEALPTAMPEGWEAVNLPHTWNAIDGQDGGIAYFYAGWYGGKRLP